MSASPPPRYEVAYFNAGRGCKWYVLTNPDDDLLSYREDLCEYAPAALVAAFVAEISGGPYGSEAEAQAEVDSRYEDLSEYYTAVEEEARRGGYTVAW